MRSEYYDYEYEIVKSRMGEFSHGKLEAGG